MDNDNSILQNNIYKNFELLNFSEAENSELSKSNSNDLFKKKKNIGENSIINQSNKKSSKQEELIYPNNNASSIDISKKHSQEYSFDFDNINKSIRKSSLNNDFNNQDIINKEYNNKLQENNNLRVSIINKNIDNKNILIEKLEKQLCNLKSQNLSLKNNMSYINNQNKILISNINKDNKYKINELNLKLDIKDKEICNLNNINNNYENKIKEIKQNLTNHYEKLLVEEQKNNIINNSYKKEFENLRIKFNEKQDNIVQFTKKIELFEKDIYKLNNILHNKTTDIKNLNITINNKDRIILDNNKTIEALNLKLNNLNNLIKINKNSNFLNDDDSNQIEIFENEFLDTKNKYEKKIRELEAKLCQKNFKNQYTMTDNNSENSDFSIFINKVIDIINDIDFNKFNINIFETIKKKQSNIESFNEIKNIKQLTLILIIIIDSWSINLECKQIENLNIWGQKNNEDCINYKENCENLFNENNSLKLTIENLVKKNNFLLEKLNIITNKTIDSNIINKFTQTINNFENSDINLVKKLKNKIEYLEKNIQDYESIYNKSKLKIKNLKNDLLKQIDLNSLLESKSIEISKKINNSENKNINDNLNKLKKSKKSNKKLKEKIANLNLEILNQKNEIQKLSENNQSINDFIPELLSIEQTIKFFNIILPKILNSKEFAKKIKKNKDFINLLNSLNI